MVLTKFWLLHHFEPLCLPAPPGYLRYIIQMIQTLYQLELFEVDDIGDDGDDDLSYHYRTIARVLDELEGNQRKENHLHIISKMIGTLVHVQLYTFSYRKPVIRPQNMPKTADWG